MIILYTILAISALAMQVFFNAAEMALTSISRIRLKSLIDSGDTHAIKLDRLLSKEGSYLGTSLVGINMGIIISSTACTRVFEEYFRHDLAPILATIVMVPLTLIFAEIVPKMIARQFATSVALRVVNPLSGFFKLFYPLITAVNATARFLIAPFKGKTAGSVDFTKSDLKKLLLLGYETGEVEAGEVEMIHRILDFSAKEVDKIMVPLYRVSSVSVDETTDNLKRLVSLTNFSRVPVYRQNKENIVGIVNIYDILFGKEADEKTRIEGYVRRAVHVRGKDRLNIVLARLRHKKQMMAIVTDNEGKAVGIVTIEDILEEIVGEIEEIT